MGFWLYVYHWKGTAEASAEPEGVQPEPRSLLPICPEFDHCTPLFSILPKNLMLWWRAFTFICILSFYFHIYFFIALSIIQLHLRQYQSPRIPLITYSMTHLPSHSLEVNLYPEGCSIKSYIGGSLYWEHNKIWKLQRPVANMRLRSSSSQNSKWNRNDHWHPKPSWSNCYYIKGVFHCFNILFY